MAVKVEQAITASAHVLETGDEGVARSVIAGDDDIDAMFVSLSERCYDLLCRQSPVASDLRLIVSVVRILSDLERMGDLCLRIVKLAPQQELIASERETFMILRSMARLAIQLFGDASRAWATGDLRLARSLEERDEAIDERNVALMEALLRLEGPQAVPIAIQTLLAGRALERIADHSVMIGERLRYMLTGNVDSLSKEVGP